MAPVRPKTAARQDRANEIDLSRFGVVSTMKYASSMSERVKGAEWAVNFAATNDNPLVSIALLAEIKVLVDDLKDPYFKAAAQHYLDKGRSLVAEKHPETVAAEPRGTIRHMAYAL